MKYPKKQFTKLVESIKVLSQYIDIKSMHPCQLHYIVYQQLSEGQPHNRLIIDNEGQIKRHYSLVDGRLVQNEGTPLFEVDNSFELYPEGTNDNHIETAVKRAIKTIFTS